MAHPPSESHELLDESCLDFLVHELGLEIPRTYRYAQGIHEVQKRLILRYGDENIARVMDIFNSLLEDENNAAGLGDDGDVWRSWRHDYKMRGTDFANPGTPRFPGIILPPSGRQSGGRVNNPSQSTHGGDVGLLGRPDMSFGSSNLEPSSPSLDRGGDIREIGQDLIIKDLQLKKRNTLRKRISHRLLAILPLTKGKQHVPPPITDQNGQPQSSRPLLYNLDGACDEPDECASPHLVRNFSPTLQSPHSPSRSEMHSFDVSTRSPTHDSGASSELSSAKYESTVSSKDGFRSLTRDLIAPERVSAEGSTASSGLYGDFRPLDPPKFNPSSPVARRSSELPDHYARYASILNANPFREERNVTWPKEQAQRSNTKPHNSHLNHPKVMGQSRSEISMARSICPSPTDTKQSQEYSPNRTNKIETILPERGRTNTRSPTKFLEGIDYDTVPELLSSPVKRSRSPIKKMFGENGWLGRSTSMKEMPSEQYRKTGLKHWGGKLKGRVEVLTEEMTRFKIRPRSPEPCSPPTSRFPISLDPPTQAKLYSEIELMICVTANAYLMMQRREGRMSVESLQRVTEFWRNKGRPQVVEFQFDQATQRDLVLYNLKSFRFYGEKAENPVALNSMMYCWKSLAKEMNVRTFCAPDSVIRKQMHDIYKILEMLGAPLTTFLAFQEIQVKALKKMRDEQERRDLEAKVEYGVERVWVPPVKGEDDESDMLGPFCGIPNPFEN